MDARPDASRTPPLARLALVLAALAGLAQAASFGRLALTAERDTRQRQAWLDLERTPSAGADVYAGASRAFRLMDAEVPAGARLLLITQVPLLIPFEVYLAPRPLRRLHAVDARQLTRWTSAVPFFAGREQQHLANLDDMGLLLTPERLEQALDWAEYVIVFLGDGGLGSAAGRLELLLEREGARLHRVREREG